MADQHRLPDAIKAIIAEHHGTSLIQYFYHQALAGCGAEARHDAVLERQFRYEGPRPRTRESGIIMLADTIEAAVRCLDKPTPARIQNRIEELVHQKLTDGQLDECDLTFKDIQKLQKAFARILSAMLHGRIDYPGLPKPAAGRSHVEQVELEMRFAAVLEAEETPSASQTVPNGGLYPELPEAPPKDPAIASGRAEGPSI